MSVDWMANRECGWTGNESPILGSKYFVKGKVHDCMMTEGNCLFCGWTGCDLCTHHY